LVSVTVAGGVPAPDLAVAAGRDLWQRKMVPPTSLSRGAVD